MTSTQPETVQAWLAAVNAADVATVLTLSAPDIAMIGPRGPATGHEILHGWLRNANATFETLATFARGESVVVAQRGVWGGGAPVEVATRFRVADGRVAELERYGDLADALHAAGLTPADAIIPNPENPRASCGIC